MPDLDNPHLVTPVTGRYVRVAVAMTYYTESSPEREVSPQLSMSICAEKFPPDQYGRTAICGGLHPLKPAVPKVELHSFVTRRLVQ